MSIRKLTIGAEYKNSMNYIVGQSVLNGTHTIHHIKKHDDGTVRVWIFSEDERVVLAWKEFSPYVPMTVEFDISF